MEGIDERAMNCEWPQPDWGELAGLRGLSDPTRRGPWHGTWVASEPWGPPLGGL